MDSSPTSGSSSGSSGSGANSEQDGYAYFDESAYLNLAWALATLGFHETLEKLIRSPLVAQKVCIFAFWFS